MKVGDKIYLDYAATTPCDPEVSSAVYHANNNYFGNTASVHSIGFEAKNIAERCRKYIADFIGAQKNQLYFVSGATEANNIVLRSAACQKTKPLVITTNVEHSSVINTLTELHENGDIDLEYLRVNRDGTINLIELEQMLIVKNVFMVSIMAANNEIGVIYPIEEIGKLCRRWGAIFHTDATQAVGKIDIDVDRFNIDALSMSAHKIYGPKGIGGLYLRNKDKFRCLTTGGRQEKITSGTLNVPGVIGFAKACELMINNNDKDHILALRDAFINTIVELVGNSWSINGSTKNRLYNNLNISFPGVSAEDLILGLDNVSISTGSACQSGVPQVSHVIEALGVPNPECAVRISFGRFNSKDDVIKAASEIAALVNARRLK